MVHYLIWRCLLVHCNVMSSLTINWCHHAHSLGPITQPSHVHPCHTDTVCCSSFQHCQVETPGSWIIHCFTHHALCVALYFILNHPRADTSSSVTVNHWRLECVCVVRKERGGEKRRGEKWSGREGREREKGEGRKGVQRG